MIQELADSLFKIEIPLPKNPLRSLNAYVIKSPDRHLIIDTGFDLPECYEAMQEGLRKLAVRLDDCDFFITHLHADHAGLVTRLITDSSRVYFNRTDAEFLMSLDVVRELNDFIGTSGLPGDVVDSMIRTRSRYRYDISSWIDRVIFVEEGDTIDAGDYSFRCIVTPGHTMGHTCLYEPEEKILIAGDHILYDITPNITCWTDGENRLKAYMSSLDRVFAMDATLILPGHRSVFSDLQGRITELKRHHGKRVSEVASILEGGPLSVAQVAAKMHWDITCESWDAFPVAQKWFATGEAMAHLRYLEDEGRITREQSKGMRRYRLTDR